MSDDIYDTSDGQCTAAANIKGEHVPCQLGADHTGWAHQNKAHEIIWSAA